MRQWIGFRVPGPRVGRQIDVEIGEEERPLGLAGVGLGLFPQVGQTGYLPLQSLRHPPLP